MSFSSEKDYDIMCNIQIVGAKKFCVSKKSGDLSQIQALKILAGRNPDLATQ